MRQLWMPFYALLLGGCAMWGGGPREVPSNPDLERSQSLISRVGQDPTVSAHFKAELEHARRDIEQAILIWNEEGGRLDDDDDEWLQIRHLNYMARQRTAIVVMKARGLDAQRELGELQSRHADDLAQARRPEPEHVSAGKSHRLPTALQVFRPRHESRGLVLTVDPQLLEGGKQQAQVDSVYDALLEYLVANPGKVVSCEGHAAGSSQSEAQRLSQQHARKVQDKLLERGLEFSRVTAVGYGASRMLAPIAITGKYRVEIVISDSDPITYDAEQ